MSKAETDAVELALKVACPSCPAGVGERCIRPDGEPARATHKRRGKAAAKADADAKAKAEREVPETVKGTRWRRVYRNCRLELEQRGDWTKLAEADLESLIRMKAASESALSAAEREPLVKGSQGQPVANPSWAIHARLETKILPLERSLRLTPDSRGASAPRGGGHGSEDADAASAAATDAARPDADVEVDELDELEEYRRKRLAEAAG